ncbi:hypothetical protein KP509_23G073800 [Ceratopteris richardii]|uniref:Uncharacterized protein n=1 Tax=Ceratopteris richardii TaxID=49495 RepID=A0A8T2S3I4_CERRI|nr:hypothetical protein KP509_23G073800 [Ceratopteris richardii]
MCCECMLMDMYIPLACLQHVSVISAGVLLFSCTYGDRFVVGMNKYKMVQGKSKQPDFTSLRKAIQEHLYQLLCIRTINLLQTLKYA